MPVFRREPSPAPHGQWRVPVRRHRLQFRSWIGSPPERFKAKLGTLSTAFDAGLIVRGRSMGRLNWHQWFTRRSIGVGKVAPGVIGGTDELLCPPCGCRGEQLEERWLLATFTDAAPTLNLVLGSNQQAAIISTGSTYQLSLNTGSWSGNDDTNVAGNGSSTLTVTNAGLGAFTTAINITDTGSTGGDSVTFNNSSAYVNSFSIQLTNSAATNGLAFSGNTTFSALRR